MLSTYLIISDLVAFCFYNLSSIFNGLVYFDQFSFLSTRNLLLVVLGIVVLLGGVWVVSIPTDADFTGGIDIGTWHETAGTEPEEDELEAGGLERDRVRQRHQSISMEPVSTPVDTIPPSSPLLVDLEDPLTHTRAPTETHSRRSTGYDRQSSDSPTASPGQPRPRGLYNYQRRRPTVPGADSQPSQRLMSPPLSTNGLPLPGGGFSIGLSPVSPGFALVPRGRDGRRVSGHGSRGFADVVQARMHLRRTASEGDAEPTEPGQVVLDGSDYLTVGGGLPLAHAEEGTSEEPPARRRWKWLRNVIDRARQ
jgi:magnesium transporter